MQAQRLENGNLLIPKRAEGPDGLLGDGMVEIGPDHPDYQEWLAEVRQWEQEQKPGNKAEEDGR